MRFLVKVKVPTESGNQMIDDPAFGQKMDAILKDVGAEAAYFTTIDGQRGGYIVVNMKDASEMPAIAEPFFLWQNATVEFLPVMTAEDLAKAGPIIAAANEKWRSKV